MTCKTCWDSLYQAKSPIGFLILQNLISISFPLFTSLNLALNCRKPHSLFFSMTLPLSG
ncbi:hypothetical protein AHAS_Ahas11G0100900 [Arachis hypogaea]